MPVVRTEHGALTKTGAGCLTVDGLATSGDVTVAAGTLALAGGALAADTVTVRAGATVRLADTVSVAIPNADFENVDDVAYPNGFCSVETQELPGWMLTRVSSNGNLAYSGWQKNGGTVSKRSDGSVFPGTTNGTHTAFLRPSSRLSTTVTVPEDGTYTFAFETGDGGEMEGQKVETASGPMVFIDAVSLVKKGLAQPSQEGVVWNFEPGATIDVASHHVELDQAFVNGVQIRGGRGAFTAAGVTVLGTGSIRSATPAGTVIVIR